MVVIERRAAKPNELYDYRLVYHAGRYLIQRSQPRAADRRKDWLTIKGHLFEQDAKREWKENYKR